ncbi:MAG: imelysin family protein [Bacteroidota bacterium]
MKKIFAILVFGLMVGCEDSEKKFDVRSLQQSILDLQIVSVHDAFETSSVELKARIDVLGQDLSSTSLSAAQQAWKECAVNYSFTEIYNIGEVDGSRVHLGIYSWEALAESIEEIITGGIKELQINTLPTGSRGMAAIEYLLFAQQEAETLSLLQDTDRLSYLQLLGTNLVEKTQSLNALWQGQSTKFVENNANGLDGSINQIINRIINTLAIAKKLKIGIPAGLESTPVDSLALQADYSLYSLELIEANLQSISNLYFQEESSLSDYVASIIGNTEVNDEIKLAFQRVQSSIDQLNEPLATAIKNQPTEVNELKVQINNLIILFTVDVSSILSITVTPTDVDGD